ncbi:hypothetical protein RB195_024440 [Necator americanus]|uniref:Uncharacterized protein n=1 Tax=Necator americanus TaxID=51031 RepID=A0ABR1ENY5_NECAM
MVKEKANEYSSLRKTLLARDRFYAASASVEATAAFICSPSRSSPSAQLGEVELDIAGEGLLGTTQQDLSPRGT